MAACRGMGGRTRPDVSVLRLPADAMGVGVWPERRSHSAGVEPTARSQRRAADEAPRWTSLDRGMGSIEKHNGVAR